MAAARPLAHHTGPPMTATVPTAAWRHEHPATCKDRYHCYGHDRTHDMLEPHYTTAKVTNHSPG